jgi:hypothetical protein
MVAPTKTISSLDPLGSLAQLGRTGMIRSLTTFYPDARREHRPAAPHACELPPRQRHGVFHALHHVGRYAHQPSKTVDPTGQLLATGLPTS